MAPLASAPARSAAVALVRSVGRSVTSVPSVRSCDRSFRGARHGRGVCRVLGEAAYAGFRVAQSSSRMRGTEKRCCSDSGAPASTASAPRLGRTTSGRVTLVSGIGCDIGATPSVGACWTLATDSRMTPSSPTMRSSSASESSIRARPARWATSSRDRDDMRASLWGSPSGPDHASGPVHGIAGPVPRSPPVRGVSCRGCRSLTTADPRTTQGEPSMTSPASPTTTTTAPRENVPAPPAAEAADPTPTASAGPAPTPTANETATGTATETATDAPADRASARAEMAEVAPRARRSPDVRAGARRAATLTGAGIRRVRTLLGGIVWFACLLAATALLLGAVLVVLDANTRNALVAAVLRAADWADLGVFSRTAGIKQFTGDGATVKNAITNWGLAAVAWLVVGRVALRVLTPRS